jgi:ribosomal protein L11 methyltransferase
VRVRPPWAAPGFGALDVVIEPGQAFGTGSHDTTPGGALADWGSGSGVLAIVAAKLGYAPVSACDHDPLALEATAAAAAANGVALTSARVDLRRAPGPWAPTVCANLVRPLLLDVAARLERPPARLIASGLARAEAGEVAAAFASRGLREAARRSAGDWSALLLTG